MDTQTFIPKPNSIIDQALQNRLNLARMRQRGARKKYQRMPYKQAEPKRVVSWTP